MNEKSTKELHEELAKREGVEEHTVGVEDAITLYDERGRVVDYVEGPAVILVNYD